MQETQIMIPMWLILPALLLPLLHQVADFELQPDWMAINKSKRWDALTYHVLIYAAVFTVVFGSKFGAITFITHFLVDAVTSRWSRRKFPWVPVSQTDQGRTLYLDVEGTHGRSRHRFFCVIGWDQMLHQYQLLLTYYFFADLWWL